MKRPRLLDLFCGAGGAAMGSPTELAWAAGFYDGEGCFAPYRDKRPGRRPGLAISIEQADERPLLRFKTAVGWHGNVVRRPVPRAPNRRVLYRIYATNDAALKIVAALWPYLSEPKREQIAKAIEHVGEGRYVATTPP